MEWWENYGKDKFPKIYVIACLILALPDSNGNQERTFSACTWMDGKLKKNQGEGTFQTKCVLYKTKVVRDLIAKHISAGQSTLHQQATEERWPGMPHEICWNWPLQLMKKMSTRQQKSQRARWKRLSRTMNRFTWRMISTKELCWKAVRAKTRMKKSEKDEKLRTKLHLS